MDGQICPKYFFNKFQKPTYALQKTVSLTRKCLSVFQDSVVLATGLPCQPHTPPAPSLTEISGTHPCSPV